MTLAILVESGLGLLRIRRVFAVLNGFPSFLFVPSLFAKEV